ncbi:MAG: AAA family ATPase [Saprospiraceae bacterium]
MSIRKAESLSEIYQAFKGEPLGMDDMAFYREANAARGGFEPRRQVARFLKQNPHTSEHILFVGYKGCGKSTELNHLHKDIGEEFLVLNFSIEDELDPVHLNYIELFIVAMEQLFSAAQKHNIKISKEYLKSIQHWIATKEIEEIKEKYNIGVELEAGAEGTIGIPYLQKFFAKFKATAKSSRSLKESIKKNIEPKLSELIGHCNTLINEISIKLSQISKKDLVIIIEDLDKVPFDRAEDLFLNYANQLTQLNTNVIFTFPIGLYYSTRFNQIKPYFSTIYELPMIQVSNKDGSKNESGYKVMHDIVKARMNIETLFSETSILDEMIFYSGGCLRDLFLMIWKASEFAQDFERDAIEAKDWHMAFQRLKQEYEANLADNTIDGKLYPVEGYYKILVELAQSPIKKVDNTEEALHLRQNLCILGYNGEGWQDVHPIVRKILEERQKLN